jgi:hypothetical protein
MRCIHFNTFFGTALAISGTTTATPDTLSCVGVSAQRGKLDDLITGGTKGQEAFHQGNSNRKELTR